MKLLFLTDSHIRGNNSTYRIGNYLNDIKSKLKDINKIAIENKVSYIIHGGDFFDAPIISLKIVDEITDIIEKPKIPWLIVPGNHDETYNNWGGRNP